MAKTNLIQDIKSYSTDTTGDLAREIRYLKTKQWQTEEKLRKLERLISYNDRDLDVIADRTAKLEREQTKTDGFKKLTAIGLFLLTAAATLAVLLIYAKTAK